VRTIDPVKHEEKRAEILEAAERCFARDGFHGATIAQICAEAKISPGHLYHYFASKEAIVGAIVDAGVEGTASRFAELTESSNAITALVSELARLRALHRKSGAGVYLDVLAEAGRSPAIGAVIQASSKGVRNLLAEDVPADSRPEARREEEREDLRGDDHALPLAAMRPREDDATDRP
jgi:AcrR family transcriptional regulator